MLKLIRTSVITSAATWAWRNRSDITKKLKKLTGTSDSEDAATGYADVVDTDGMMKPSEFEQSTNA